MQVCREAALVTKGSYPTAFQERGVETSLNGWVRFNFCKDMLYISERTFASDRYEYATSPVNSIRYFRPADAVRVKRLILSLNGLNDPETAIIREVDDLGQGTQPAVAMENPDPCREDWGHDEHDEHDEDEIAYLRPILRILRHFHKVEELFLVGDFRTLCGINDCSDPELREPTIGPLALTDPEDIPGSLSHYFRPPNIKANEVFEDELRFSMAEEIMERLCEQLEKVNEEREKLGKMLFKLPNVRIGALTSREELQELAELREKYYQDPIFVGESEASRRKVTRIYPTDLAVDQEDEDPLKVHMERLDYAGKTMSERKAWQSS